MSSGFWVYGRVAAVALVLGLVAGAGVVGVSAQSSSTLLPPFSIYGTPTPPSNTPLLNSTGELWGPYFRVSYLTWFTTSEAIIEALVNGYIQYDGAGVGNIEQYNQLLPYAKAGEIALNETLANGFGYIGFNTHVYPTDNVYFRQAIAHLVNYQDVAAVLYNGILGFASPYWFQPGIYEPPLLPQSEFSAYQEYGAYNTSAAIQDLELAGFVDHPAQGYWSYPNGTSEAQDPLVIYYSTGPNQQLEVQLLSVVTSAAASINFTIVLQGVSFDTLAYTLLPTLHLEMYLLGWRLGAPPTPVSFYRILGPTSLNTKFAGDYVNPYVWRLLTNLVYDSPTIQVAAQYMEELGVALFNWTPYVILDWGATLTPVNVQGWVGNVFEPVYGILFPSNIHPANSVFGDIYRVGLPQPVQDLNIYTARDVYSFDFLGTMTEGPLGISYSNPDAFAPNVVYNWTVSAGSGLMPNGHHWNGTVITMKFLPGVVWQDGTPLTAIDYNFTLWYFDVGGFSSNPYNPSQHTVTYAPGVVFNYSDVVAHPSFEWFGAAPSFVGSYVPPNDPYELVIYFNTTSIFNLRSVYGIVIVPEHVFYDVPQSALYNEGASAYLRQEVWSGPYVFQAWSLTGSYAESVFFPSYFLANPYTNQVNATQGSTATFTVNVSVPNYNSIYQTPTGYYMGSYTPITNGTGVVYLLNSQTGSVMSTYTLTNQGNGIYAANIPTSGLQVGTYLLVGVVNWTGPQYYYYTGSGSAMHDTYTYHVYGVLNVQPQFLTPTSSATSTSPTPTSSATSTSPTPTPTTTSTSSFSPAVGVVVALVVVAVVLVALFAARGRRQT